MQLTARQYVSAFRTNLRVAPRSLVVLGGAVALFCVLLGPLNVFGSAPLREAFAEHLGWWWLPLLLPIAGLALEVIATRRWAYVRGLIVYGLLCALSAVYHAYELGRGYQMPFLKVSPWLVSWEAALAVIIVLVGTSQRVRSWCKGGP